ncbi:MAG TPA: helix-turn-helix transcriptional regulator [Candidatus Dormibacteraeota bacterium]|nr:helix-turn-helix transcriptional regulator [Candidatus Dormibacteraeota bacterium]
MRWGPAGQPVGRYLAEARRARGLTLAQLAERLDVSAANISRIEHGADLRVSTLLDLARALKLEPMLVSKEHVPAVRALLSTLEHPEAAEDHDRARFA